MPPEPLDSLDGSQERPAALAINTTLMVSSRALACLTQPGPPGGGLSVPTPSPPAKGSKELRWPFVRPQGHTRALRATEGMESGAGVEAWGEEPSSLEASGSSSHGSGVAGPHTVLGGEAEAGPGCRGCFAGVYGRQNSFCVQSRLRFWGLGGNGRVEKQRAEGGPGGEGQKWMAFSDSLPRGQAAFIASTWASTSTDPLLAWRLLLFIPRMFLKKGSLT